jgi:hypothetical protein
MWPIRLVASIYCAISRPALIPPLHLQYRTARRLDISNDSVDPSTWKDDYGLRLMSEVNSCNIPSFLLGILRLLTSVRNRDDVAHSLPQSEGARRRKDMDVLPILCDLLSILKEVQITSEDSTSRTVYCCAKPRQSPGGRSPPRGASMKECCFPRRRRALCSPFCTT